MDDRKISKISFAKPGLNYFNREDWPVIFDFLTEHINLLEASVRPCLSDLNRDLAVAGVQVDDT